MGKNDAHDFENVVSLHGWRERQTRPEPKKEEPTIIPETPPEDTRHPIDRYCDYLLEHADISPIERQRLATAIADLLRILPHVDQDVIEGVREEMTGELVDLSPDLAESNDAVRKVVPRTVSKWEHALWAKSTETLIPGFDLNIADDAFFVWLSEDPGKGISFLPKAKPRDILSVPHWLDQGELFFFIVLRMFRQQHEKNERIREEAEQARQRRYLEWQSQPLWYRLTNKAP